MTNSWLIAFYMFFLILVGGAAMLSFQMKVKGQSYWLQTQFRYSLVYRSNGRYRKLQTGSVYLGPGDRKQFGFGDSIEYGNHVSFEKVFLNMTGLQLCQQHKMQKELGELGYDAMFEIVEESGIFKLRAASSGADECKDLYYKKDDRTHPLPYQGINYAEIATLDGNLQTVTLVVSEDINIHLERVL